MAAAGWSAQPSSANHLHDAKYFWPRPSATPGFAYNPLLSGGSNLGPAHPELIRRATERIARLRETGSYRRDPCRSGICLGKRSGSAYFSRGSLAASSPCGPGPRTDSCKSAGACCRGDTRTAGRNAGSATGQRTDLEYGS